MDGNLSIQIENSSSPTNISKLPSLIDTCHFRHATNGESKTRQRAQVHDLVQSYLLIWLDDNQNDSNVDHRKVVPQLQKFVDIVEIFHNIDECIIYINGFKNERVFLIIAGTLADYIVPHSLDIPQIYSVCVYCPTTTQHVHSAIAEWPKVRGIFKDIDSICQSISCAAHECDADTVKMTSQSETFFMHSILFKEIIVGINFNETVTISDLAVFTRQLCAYAENEKQLELIDRFVLEYRGNANNQPVKWYNQQCFMYRLLNKAFNTIDIDILLKSQFFIRDLQQNIQDLYTIQLADETIRYPCILYYGQTITKQDFHTKVHNNQLISFNNFLCMSQKRDAAIGFIRRKLRYDNTKLGVLFVITVESSINSTPFASIAEFSQVSETSTFLFPIHTVYRVQAIEQIQENETNIQQVSLRITTEGNNKRLSELMRSIRHEIIGTGWQRLGYLLWKMGENAKAEQIYKILLQKATKDSERAYYCNQLGLMKKNQGDYDMALEYFNQSIEIKRKTHSEDHIDFAACYSNVGQVYSKMGDCPKAIEYYEKALKIKKTLPLENQPNLAASYNNIGLLYNTMREYVKALEYYEKALNIKKITLSEHHPDLSTFYTNIGLVYNNMRNYSQALEHYEKALEIKKKALPENHIDLVACYLSIGQVHNKNADFIKALQYFEKALDIRRVNLSENHPDLASSYGSLGLLYNDMGDYNKALEHYEKMLSIRTKCLNENHLDLAASYGSMGQVYSNLGEYKTALDYYKRSFTIKLAILLDDHPSLAISYVNFAACYEKMGEYSRALKELEHALDIQQRLLDEENPGFAFTYSWLGRVYRSMEQYTKSLSYFEKCLAIDRKTLPDKHPNMVLTYGNIGDVYRLIGNYETALLYHQKGLDVQETIDFNPIVKAATYVNIGETYRELDGYTTALRYYQKAINIREQKLPKNHPDLASLYHNMARVYFAIHQLKIAMELVQKAIRIAEEKLSQDHPHLAVYKETFEKIRMSYVI